MKKTLSKIILTLIITTFISFFASVSVYAEYNIPGANDLNDYWGMIKCCDQNDANTSKTPEITLTFSEDGTKITKVETSGYYTNTSSERLLTWSGMGFGITDAADPAHYFNRWLFKGTDANGFCKASDSLQSSPNYLSDAYILYSFTSNNCYDKNTLFNNVVLEPKSSPTENIVKISDFYELTDSDNSKLDSNKVYYVHFILQGWAPGENNAPRWGTLQSASFKISDNANYRYSANFNYNGHGGTNFTLPIKKNSSVSSAIAGSVDEKWTTEQKGIVTNWQTAVTAPTASGCAFQGWYEDQELTTSADFTKAFGETNGSRTYYAKWEELDYTITKEATTNGSFTVEVEETEVTEAKMNKEVVITPTSDSGYDVDKVCWKKTGDTNYTEITNNSGYKFTMPNSNVNIKVTFKSTPVAKIGNTIFYSVSNAVKSISENGIATIDLLCDSNETETINIALNKTVTLNLNGYMIKGKGDSNVITVDGSSLIINDTDPTSYHYFKYNNDAAWEYLSNYSPNGNEILFDNIDTINLVDGTSIIKIFGGLITGGVGKEISANYHCGGAIYITSSDSNNASVTLNNGFIVGNNAYNGGGIYLNYSSSNDHSLTISGGKIIGNYAAQYGGGVDLTGSSRIVMDSGRVSYNVSNPNDSYGGGVNLDDYSSFIMNGGSISNNIGDEGGGVRVGDFSSDATATFTMNNGVIKNNYAKASGGGIYSVTTFIMNGGEISNNTSIQEGGGVLVMNHSSVSNNFTMNGGIIRDNIGGGVYAYGNIAVGGNSSITANSYNSLTKNLYLYENKKIDIKANFNGNIGISVYQSYISDYVTLASQSNKNFASYFTSDNSNYHVFYKKIDNKYILVLGPQKKLQVTGAKVNNKIYDGSCDGVAEFTNINGIKTNDIGKINVSVSSVTFADSNVGNDIDVSIKYDISGDDEILQFYLKPDDQIVKANITRKDITVKAKNIIIKKGDALPNNSSDFVEPIDGILNDYQVIYSVSPLSNTNTVGIFRTVISGNADQNNYHINFVNGSVSVVDNTVASIARTDPAKLSKVLDQYSSTYPGAEMSINLSVSDASGSSDEQMNLNLAGINNEIDSYESKIYIDILTGNQIKIDVTDTGYELIPIEYDFDFVRKYDVHVWRTHDYSGNKVVEEITFIPNADGEFVVYNYTDKLITVWAKKYSTYSITYKELQDSIDSSSPSYVPVKTCVD